MMKKKLKLKQFISKSLFTSSILSIVTIIYFFMFKNSYTYTYQVNYENIIKNQEKFYNNYDNFFVFNINYSPKDVLHRFLQRFYDEDKIKLFSENYLNDNSSNNYKKNKEIIKRTKIQGAYFLNPRLYGPLYLKVLYNKELDKKVIPKYVAFNLTINKDGKEDIFKWTSEGKKFRKNLEKNFFNAIIAFDKLSQNKSDLYKKNLTELKELKNHEDYFYKNYISLINKIDILYKEASKEMYKVKGSVYSSLEVDINKLKLDLKKNKIVLNKFNSDLTSLSEIILVELDIESEISLKNVKLNYKLFFSLILYSIIFSFFANFVIFEIRNFSKN